MILAEPNVTTETLDVVPLMTTLPFTECATIEDDPMTVGADGPVPRTTVSIACPLRAYRTR